MKKRIYKILALSDLNDSTKTVLKSSVSLANMIHGEIHFFHVKKPIEVVKSESQLSAIRTLNHEHLAIEKKIENAIKSISKDYNVDIKYKFSIGNVKNEIANQIKEQEPDIIVLGKRDSKGVKLLGDSITQFILNKHKGPVMIASTENAIEPNQDISLGMLNGLEESFNVEFADDLMAHIQKPLKTFKLVKGSNLKEEETSTDNKTVEYVFEHGIDALDNLSKYLSKSRVNLLCIDRDSKQKESKKNMIMTDIKEAINKFNVSLLLTGGEKLTIQ